MLSWGSRPSELTPPRFWVRRLVSTHAGGKAPCHARLQAPSHRGCTPRPGLRRSGSRARDPSTRRVYRTPRITVERRPSSPRASRALSCASRQPRPAPCRALKDGASCSCPLFGGTPRLPALHDALPRKGAPAAGPRRRSFVEPCTRSRPLRSRLAAEPLAELDLVPRRRVDPNAPDFRQPRPLCDPPLREEQVGGGPPCRQVGRLSWDFVPCRLDSKVQATSGAGLFAFRIGPFRIRGPYGRFTSGETPRHRDAVRPRPPTTRAVRHTVSRSPEPVELSPAGVSFESLRFGDRAR